MPKYKLPEEHKREFEAQRERTRIIESDKRMRVSLLFEKLSKLVEPTKTPKKPTREVTLKLAVEHIQGPFFCARSLTDLDLRFQNELLLGIINELPVHPSEEGLVEIARIGEEGT